jgi:peptide/nickel transport system ATP-binding protein
LEISHQNKPVVEVQNLRVSIPTRRGTLGAINDVSFSIGEGEIVGVVGESGAGKSLSGASIIGLLEPPGHVSGGEIRLEGRRIDNLGYEEMRALRGKKIGAIFQDPLTSLNPVYTIGRQLVETIQAHTDMNAEQARAHAIHMLKDVGIPAAESRIDSYPHHFSGGMRQRVVIALALCVNPKLIIADEPTTALDVSIQAQILALLKKMCREHKTAIMLITHDMGVIAEITDRVIVMYAGRIAEAGPTGEVVRNPKHPYTKGLMGSIVRIGNSVDRLPQIEGSMPRLSAIPPGCAFNPRCPDAFERCRAERPDLMDAGTSNAACWLYAKGGAPSIS